MKNRIFLLVAIFLMSHVVNAQRLRNATEANQNKKAIAANEVQLERDLAELKAYKVKLAAFETAFAKKDGVKIAALKTELTTAMQREIEQSERKIAQDREELAQSQSELAAAKRETNRSRLDRATIDNDTKDARDVRDDQRDKKDDQRDLQDDKTDLERQIARTNRQKQIYATLKAFTFSFKPSFRQKSITNKALFEEFVITMENDIAATKVEIAEDKQEAKEDEKERREDRRERAEKRRNRN